jgi:ATP-dependent Clp protease ATP-binding subunit ClpB
MSEFMEKHSVARLIGAPPGYVGYEEGGYLTELVRRKPYSVILMDEIEKAHPDVFNVLLQVLDDGRLTDGQGRTVDFRNTVIVMTSNLGSDIIQELAGEALYPVMKAAVMEKVSQSFRPEFINRIDEVIAFRSLAQVEIETILDQILAEMARSLASTHGRRLRFTCEARKLIIAQGYSPEFGVRHLRRAIQTLVEMPLSHLILAGEFASFGGIIVDVESNRVVLKPEPENEGRH